LYADRDPPDLHSFPTRRSSDLEEGDAVRRLLVRRLHLDDVALHPETPAAEHRVVADVLRVDQLPQHQVAVVLFADLEDDHALPRSEEHTSELQSLAYLVCRLLL